MLETLKEIALLLQNCYPLDTRSLDTVKQVKKLVNDKLSEPVKKSIKE